MAIGKSLFLAESDEPTFLELFKEEMPEHMKNALYFEIEMWTTLRTSLDNFSKTNLSFEAYKKKTKALSDYIRLLIQVIELQIEILYSPLSNHFRELLKEIMKKLQKQ